MPTFINPKYVHVEPGGGGAGGVLLAAGVVVVAAGAGVLWLVREVLRIWVELAIIAGGTAVFVVVLCVWMAIHFNRGTLPVNQAAKAEAIANARRPALPAGDVHHHVHYEEHHHLHQAPAAEQHVHVHQAPAAEPRPAIAARKVVPGVVGGETAPKAIGVRKAPLYRITTSERQAIEENEK